MLFWLIPLILIGLALCVIFVIVLRKVPQLRIINPDSIPKEKVRRLKEQLVMDRLNRVKNAKVGGVTKAAKGAAKKVSKVGRRAVQKVYALEQYYAKMHEPCILAREKEGCFFHLMGEIHGDNQEMGG